MVLSGRPGTTGFGRWFEVDGAAPSAPATESKLTHARIGGSGQVEVESDEYDEHEVVPLAQVVHVRRGGVSFPPASTVQELRAALWSRA